VTVWIVDYDLPQTSNRRQFYREIQRFLKKGGGSPAFNWSTQSVVITGDKEFADFVYEQASHLGHAHIYKAEKIK
jgi:hypothetical protein